MRKLDIEKAALRFLNELDAKQYRQVGGKVFALLAEPQPADCAKLKGYDDYWRVDPGEYRIVYQFTDETVYVVLISKRNDDKVYKDLANK